MERLESRVVAPLKAYGDIVKNKRVSQKIKIKNANIREDMTGDMRM